MHPIPLIALMLAFGMTFCNFAMLTGTPPRRLWVQHLITGAYWSVGMSCYNILGYYLLFIEDNWIKFLVLTYGTIFLSAGMGATFSLIRVQRKRTEEFQRQLDATDGG